MIDKNGKLFGKINIIDLLIIIVLIAAAIFVCTRVFGSDNGGEASAGNDVYISFYGNEAELGFDKEGLFYEGAPAYEDITNAQLGELTEWSVEPAYEYQLNSDGEQVKVDIPNGHFVTVTLKANGTLADDGFHVASSVYCIGAHYTIHVGTTKIYVECCDITPVD